MNFLQEVADVVRMVGSDGGGPLLSWDIFHCARVPDWLRNMHAHTREINHGQL